MVIGKLIRLCLGIVKKILKIAAVVILFLVVLSLIPNLPPYIEYNAYNVTPPVPLKGALGINTLLNNAERLYEGALKGPEAFDVYNGVIYTGVHGGEIVKFVDGNIVPVAKFGQPCDGFWEEKKCGRPLGMKFGPDGFLYVADAYYGLFKVNVNDGTYIQLVSAKGLIKDKPIKLPNSVDIAEDGTVYWTISSSDFHLEDGVFDMLADGSGRLLRYDPKKKTNEVLIDNLHFANGVVLSSKEEFLLVSETARSRIHRYYLKGPKKGVHDIFLDGLPGLPDNLKSDGSNGFFIPLVLGRDSSNPVIFQSLGPFPSIRRAFSRFLTMLELLFGQIDSAYPNYYATRAIHFIGHFESVNGIGPKRVSILHVDESGKIKSSYHATDGKLTGISEVHWFNGAFYLGSPYNPYVGRVAIDIPELRNQKKLPVKEEPILKKQVQDHGQLKKPTKQEQEKRPITEQKPSSDIHQQKKSVKEEKKEQSKPVPQPKQPSKSDRLAAQQQKEQPKVQEKPAVQQSKETVNEGKQSAAQKPQAATPKPPVQQQQRQQSAETPAHQQRPADVPKSTAQQKKQSAEVPKPSGQQQKKQSAEVPKPAEQQQKKQSAEVPKPSGQQQKKQSAEVPKPAGQQQKKQSAEVPKPAEQQKKQSAEVHKPTSHQQKQEQRPADVPKSTAQKKQSAEVPKPSGQQQQRPADIPKSTAQKKQSAEIPKPSGQQQQRPTDIPKSTAQKKQSAEVPKPATEQKQQKRSTETPKSAAPQQKQSTEVPKPTAQQEKQLNEQKTAQHQKPHAKETKSQQKEQPVNHKPAVQQQPQESKPVTQQQKKTTDQQEPAKAQKASVEGKKPVQPEKLSSQQEQPSETSHQKPKVQDKTPPK